MAAFNKFNTFVLELTKAGHNLSTDTLKVLLSNTLPLATNAATADITQIANGNGYVTGGSTAAFVSNTQTSGVQKLILSNVVFTATGAVGPFRYAVLTDSTTNKLIGWWDYGSAITMANGDTFTVQFDGTNGVVSIT